MGLDDFIKTRLRWAPVAIVASPILIAATSGLEHVFLSIGLRFACPATAARRFCVAGELNETTQTDDYGEQAAT